MFVCFAESVFGGYYQCVYSGAVEYGEWFTVRLCVYMCKSSVTQYVYF